ncbi:MAG: MarR family transcriptional regulator [Xenophilus sp.]
MPLESRLHRLLADRPASLRDAIAASRMLLRAASLLERRIDAALAPHGLTMREYLALILIADDAVEPLRPSDLGVSLDASRTRITRLLDGLEARGLVRRVPDAADRRSLHLTQTEAGAALVAMAAPLAHKAYLAAWAPLGEDGTRQAGDALRRLHDHLAEGAP